MKVLKFYLNPDPDDPRCVDGTPIAEARPDCFDAAVGFDRVRHADATVCPACKAEAARRGMAIKEGVAPDVAP